MNLINIIYHAKDHQIFYLNCLDCEKPLIGATPEETEALNFSGSCGCFAKQKEIRLDGRKFSSTETIEKRSLGGKRGAQKLREQAKKTGSVYSALVRIPAADDEQVKARIEAIVSADRKRQNSVNGVHGVGVGLKARRVG
jgi:hypothetical protein